MMLLTSLRVTLNSSQFLTADSNSTRIEKGRRAVGEGGGGEGRREGRREEGEGGREGKGGEDERWRKGGKGEGRGQRTQVQ